MGFNFVYSDGTEFIDEDKQTEKFLLDEINDDIVACLEEDNYMSNLFFACGRLTEISYLSFCELDEQAFKILKATPIYEDLCFLAKCRLDTPEQTRDFVVNGIGDFFKAIWDFIAKIIKAIYRWIKRFLFGGGSDSGSSGGKEGSTSIKEEKEKLQKNKEENKKSSKKLKEKEKKEGKKATVKKFTSYDPNELRDYIKIISDSFTSFISEYGQLASFLENEPTPLQNDHTEISKYAMRLNDLIEALKTSGTLGQNVHNLDKTFRAPFAKNRHEILNPDANYLDGFNDVIKAIDNGLTNLENTAKGMEKSVKEVEKRVEEVKKETKKIDPVKDKHLADKYNTYLATIKKKLSLFVELKNIEDYYKTQFVHIRHELDKITKHFKKETK